LGVSPFPSRLELHRESAIFQHGANLECLEIRTARERGPVKAHAPTRRLCMLLVTHQCNLNCVYCYEAFKSGKSMSMETAVRVVTAEFDLVARSGHFDELSIDFMGGEPMIQFDLIRDIAEWIWSAQRPAPYILFSTTNGTLLEDRSKDWFRRHKERFCLGLSLDGTPSMHDANRGRSFERIDLDFFRRTWPDQPIKMTVSPGTIASLAQGILFLQKAGFKVGASPGQGLPWEDESIGEFGRQLRKLAEYYLEHEDVPPVSLLDLPIQRALGSGGATPRKYCGTGTHIATYDVDGRAYPCHLFTPLVLGTSKCNEWQALRLKEGETVTDPRCGDCVLREICPTCCGFNYKLTGDVARRDPFMCRLFKVQASTNCWFQTQRLKRARRVGSLSIDQARTAKACLRVVEQLSTSTWGP
jgi:uncharacterized protein